MTGYELKKLWELYPDVRSLYEQYNGIRLDDDTSWKCLTEEANKMLADTDSTELKKQAVFYTVAELERTARKRC